MHTHIHIYTASEQNGPVLSSQVASSDCRCLSSEPLLSLLPPNEAISLGVDQASKQAGDLKQTYTTHRVKAGPLYAPLWRINAGFWQCYRRRMCRRESGIILCCLFPVGVEGMSQRSAKQKDMEAKRSRQEDKEIGAQTGSKEPGNVEGS